MSRPEKTAGRTAAREQPRRRPGGRTARVGAAVMEATKELLAEEGFAGLSIEAISARSGVHRTTIYRRWGSREGLVAAALAAQAESEVPVPDTGALRSDLATVARSVADNLESPLGRAMARALVGQADDPAVAGLTGDFWSARFGATAVVVERAVERGELPAGTDPRFVVEMVVSVVWFRSIVTRRPLDDALIGDVVDTVVSGIRCSA